VTQISVISRGDQEISSLKITNPDHLFRCILCDTTGRYYRDEGFVSDVQCWNRRNVKARISGFISARSYRRQLERSFRRMQLPRYRVKNDSDLLPQLGLGEHNRYTRIAIGVYL